MSSGRSRKLDPILLAAGFCAAGIPALALLAGAAELPRAWRLRPHPERGVAAMALALALASIPLLLRAFLTRRLAPPLPARSSLVRGVAAALLAIAACVPYFLVEPDNYTFDARMVVAVADSPEIMASAPLGHWGHHLAYRALELFSDPARDSPESLRLEAVRLSSRMAGVVAVVSATCLAPGLFPALGAAPAVLFLAWLPLALLYTGYLEFSPLAHSLLLLHVLLGARLLTRDTVSPLPPTLAAMAAVGAHGGPLFGMAGQALLVRRLLLRGAAARGGDDRAVLRALPSVLPHALLPFAALGSAMLAAYLLRHRAQPTAEWPWSGSALGGGDMRRWIWFSTPPPDAMPIQYVFLSPDYLVNVAQLVLFAFPLAPLIPIAIRGLARMRAPELPFLVAVLAGEMLLALFWNPDLGYDRDFDLLAYFPIPAAVLLLAWWNRALPGGPAGRWMLPASAVLAMLLSAGPRVAPRSQSGPEGANGFDFHMASDLSSALPTPPWSGGGDAPMRRAISPEFSERMRGSVRWLTGPGGGSGDANAEAAGAFVFAGGFFAAGSSPRVRLLLGERPAIDFRPEARLEVQEWKGPGCVLEFRPTSLFDAAGEPLRSGPEGPGGNGAQGVFLLRLSPVAENVLTPRRRILEAVLLESGPRDWFGVRGIRYHRHFDAPARPDAGP